MFRMQKQGFLDYKNVILTQWENVHFSIFLKNLKFLPSLIFFEKDLDMMLNNVLNGEKKAF